MFCAYNFVAVGYELSLRIPKGVYKESFADANSEDYETIVKILKQAVSKWENANK